MSIILLRLGEVRHLVDSPQGLFGGALVQSQICLTPHTLLFLPSRAPCFEETDNVF